MKRCFLGTLVFLRHGQTDYTDIFPDLTEAGIRTILRSATQLIGIVSKHVNVDIFSSPLARARGTAAIIAKSFDHKKKVEIKPALRSADIRNAMEGKALFLKHTAKGGMRQLSIAYSTDPKFDDPKIIEPRSEVRKRFFEHLAMVVRILILYQQSPPCIVHTSHYETLYHLVEELFELNYEQDEPLGHGEIIAISVYDIGIQNVVDIEVTFRKKVVVRNFDYQDQEIV